MGLGLIYMMGLQMEWPVKPDSLGRCGCCHGKPRTGWGCSVCNSPSPFAMIGEPLRPHAINETHMEFAHYVQQQEEARGREAERQRLIEADKREAARRKAEPPKKLRIADTPKSGPRFKFFIRWGDQPRQPLSRKQARAA